MKLEWAKQRYPFISDEMIEAMELAIKTFDAADRALQELQHAGVYDHHTSRAERVLRKVVYVE